MTLPGAAPRRRSLRHRMVLTFAGLALIPFVVSLLVLFFVARHDVGELQGSSIAQEARLLKGLLQSQLEAGARTVAGLGSLPGVRDHLAGGGPYPHEQLSVARRFLPGIRRLDLVRPEPGDQGPVGPGLGSVSWGTEETLEYRLAVYDLDGAPVGFVEVSFDLERLRRTVDWFRRGEEGRAVLFTGEGGRLLGAEEVPLPPAKEGVGWVSFTAEGKSYLAGVTPVEPGTAGLSQAWFLAVVQPAAEVYAPFYFVVQQVTILLVAFAGVVVALAWRMADQFLRPILRIRHGAEIVARTNLAHRIEVHTGDELEELATEFNHMAQSLATVYGELEERVRDTTSSLQEERNRLAAVLRTMEEGVVATNEAGEVLLMNPRARVALGWRPSTGIGEPLATLLPARRLDFYLKRLRRAWEAGTEAAEAVTFPSPEGGLLRGSLSVVPGPGGERAGFLLVFREVGAAVQEARETDETLRQLPELLKGPVATAASLAEAMERHPEMPAPKRLAFLGAVREELGRVGVRIGAVEETLAGRLAAESLVATDPRELVDEAVASVPGVFARLEMPEGPVPAVLVEPFAWVSALACVLRWIAEKSTGWVPVGASLGVEEDTVVTGFRVEGSFSGDPAELPGLPVETASATPVSLAEVVRANRGELWARPTEDGVFEVRLALMRAQASTARPRGAGIADDQPEFYNFDLFLPRPSQEPEDLLRTPLSSLEFVVFDTETTGLHPSRGDEVVSLSAVRVRRGRVQTADTFHTLVNPGRPIPPESIRFHGLTDQAVADAPRIADVLPRFYSYVGKAVLVAHNAAFDKKFLDLAAQRAKQPLLDNAVLDTLFLSYGIHKDFEGHNLDAIAQRLGVEVEGRHTSLGDARTTAEVFLRLVALLSARGVATLGDAKAYCDRMLLLRWQSSRF